MPRRTVYFAKITRARQMRLGNTADFRTDILRAINPDVVAERYGRFWRFARPMAQDGFVVGQLGFTHEGEELQAVYDEAAKAFRTGLGPARQTVYSHFVIDPANEVMAFEDRGREIRRQSFVGAFIGLLEAANFEAAVELLTDPVSLREWARTVDRVVKVRVQVFNPNPGWVEDAGAFREFIVETDADSADVTLKASQGDGLNVGAPPIEGAMHQISEHGQGSASAIGLRGETPSRWTSGQAARTEDVVEERTDTSVTIWGRLIALTKAIYDR